jgi:drug/metabolite transporter (DMT)-like permease
MVSLNIVACKHVLSSVPTLTLLMIRFTLATLILLPLHWCTKDKQLPIHVHFKRLTKKDWGFLFAQALCAGMLFNTLMLVGLHYTDANVAGIITSALPAIIALMSWLMLGETLSSKKGLCLLFATFGLLVIAYDKLQHVGSDHSFLGDGIILLSLIPEALYYVLYKYHPSSLPVFLVSSLFNGINAILLTITLCFLHPDFIRISHGDWWILILLGLTSGLFYVFWMLGSLRVDGLMTSLSTAIMPVATVVLARILLHEQLTLGQGIGMGLVIFSIVLYAKR